MPIIVLVEPRKEMSTDFGAGKAVSFPKAVHAAPADSDVAGDPAELTFCGKPTAGMEPLPHMPKGPGGSWYPGGLSQYRCRDCDRALHSL
ncbi:hypothetical protein [Streptomyces sp. NPDC057403]|uniref:hypothetical protein n=1 Tax=Streptomyces sp. NPDC057403 TaxID=3346119 RepID=UPI0036CC6D7C